MNDDTRFFYTPPPTRSQARATTRLAAFAFLFGVLPVVGAVYRTRGVALDAGIALAAVALTFWAAARWARANLARTRVANVLFVAALAPAAPFWAGAADRVLVAYDDAREAVGQEAPLTEAPPQAAGSPLRLVAWNVNSGVDRGGNDQQLPFIAEQLRTSEEIDVFALSEVQPDWVGAIEGAADESGRPYGIFWTESGRNQRIAIVFAEDRLELLGRNEMTGVGASEYHRNPLAATFRDRESGVRFEVVAVHFARGNEGYRLEEAGRLARLLATRGTDPVIVLGDLNADCPLDRAPEGCDPSFGRLVADGGLTWVAPAEHRETTCTTRYDDMLDLVLAGRGAEGWQARVEVLHQSEFCTNMASGAHYPVYAEFVPTP